MLCDSSIMEEAELIPNLISPLVLKMNQDATFLIWANLGIEYHIFSFLWFI